MVSRAPVCARPPACNESLTRQNVKVKLKHRFSEFVCHVGSHSLTCSPIDATLGTRFSVFKYPSTGEFPKCQNNVNDLDLENELIVEKSQNFNWPYLSQFLPPNQIMCVLRSHR